MNLETAKQKLVKNWYGDDQGHIESLTIHNLICALDDAKCDVANGYGHPLLPLLVQKVLDEKLLTLATLPEQYPLRGSLGKVKQIYLLVRPKHMTNMNRLFVYTDAGRPGALGVDYMPEDGQWGHGHYNISQQAAEQYIRDEYGMAIPLLPRDGTDE